MSHSKSRQASFDGWDDDPSSAVDSAATTRAANTTAPPEPAEAAAFKLEDLAGRTVYVIDSHSLIFQVFHALPPMTTPAGQAVGAVYGFTRDLVYLIEEKKPDYLFCAFDMPGKTFRHALYERYKETRETMPIDLQPQIPMIEQVIEAMAIPKLGVVNFEADDVLATVARICNEQQAYCYLVTGDKDCRQLITDYVKVYNIRKNQVYDEAALQADWGIAPKQVIDFQSLVGDSVDCIPGVPLIGPKIAQGLLSEYGTLEGVFEHVDQMKKGKRKQNLIEHQESALLSRQLVRLDDRVPVDIDWTAGRLGGLNPEACEKLFQEFGFRGLTEKVVALGERRHVPQVWEADYQLVSTQQALDELVARLQQQSLLSVDLETTHRSPRWAEIVGYAFAYEPGEAYYVAVRGPRGETELDPLETLKQLRPILENPQIKKLGQNLKYDSIVLRSAGVGLQGVEFDTMVASYLLDAGGRNHDLDYLAKTYLKHDNTKITELIGTGKNQKRMDEVPCAQVAAYAGEDADVPLRLYPLLAERLAEGGLDKLFHDLEVPLIDVLVELEFNGIRVDIPRLQELSEKFGARLDVLEREIYELAGREFNISSPKQLGEVLYQEQKLPVVKRTKSGPSTDVGVLEELARSHPLPRKIIEYRQYAKLKNTYVDALPQLVFPQTQRVHASFNQVVAATGRLSSSDPNLQNIPIRTETGREIRSAFLPEEGWTLVAADYSQIELRVLAHFCQDPTLRQAFAADEDIHALVASQVYDVPLAEVTPEMRRNAKAVNFGVIYGQSPFGLANQLNIERDEAEAFIEAYFARYASVDAFLTEVLNNCRRDGFVRTISGRKRTIAGIRPDPPRRQRNLAERTAINTVIQGSAADLIKRAMLNLHRRLRDESWRSRMLLQIHDELIFEAPPEEIDALIPMVRAEMSTAESLDVPIKVDVKTGKTWADTEPYG